MAHGGKKEALARL